MNFLDISSKRTQISSLIKIRPVGVELFHTDGHDKLTVAFRSGSRTVGVSRRSRTVGVSRRSRTVGVSRRSRTVGVSRSRTVGVSRSRTVGVSRSTFAEGLAFLKQTKELRLAGAKKCNLFEPTINLQ
jgi:hypothetical protein